jgi:hypothetical protein
MIYDLYPAALITKDNHGETPLNYLIEVSGAEDLLSFFLEMRGKRFGVEYPMEFDKLFKADRHSLFFCGCIKENHQTRHHSAKHLQSTSGFLVG